MSLECAFSSSNVCNFSQILRASRKDNRQQLIYRVPNELKLFSNIPLKWAHFIISWSKPRGLMKRIKFEQWDLFIDSAEWNAGLFPPKKCDVLSKYVYVIWVTHLYHGILASLKFRFPCESGEICHSPKWQSQTYVRPAEYLLCMNVVCLAIIMKFNEETDAPLRKIRRPSSPNAAMDVDTIIIPFSVSVCVCGCATRG